MQKHMFHPFLLILAACVLCACQPAVPMQPAAAVLSPTPIKSTLASTAVPVKELTAIILPTLAPTKSTPETSIMDEVPVPIPLAPPLQAVVTQVKANLAKFLSIDASKIELAEMYSVTWPDSSLGCPKPGMSYAQVMVEGLRIRLKVGDQAYEYHSGGSRPAFLCKE